MNKEHIIKEIIRTAKENNGVPLGRRKFENETGIKYTDWYGKYWTRWSDAIEEAGFKPRKWQSAYDEKWLIEQVILLMRELKKFPTVGDIRMKSFNSKDFPRQETIRRRLGGKSQLVGRIISQCKDRSEYQDIMEICKKIHVPIDKIDKEYFDHQNSNIQFGYVYLMKSGRYYKIGKSNFVERRKYDIGIKLPEEVKIIHKIKTDDPNGIEAYWHKRFENKRKQGEWFELSPIDISSFKRKKFM